MSEWVEVSWGEELPKIEQGKTSIIRKGSYKREKVIIKSFNKDSEKIARNELKAHQILRTFNGWNVPNSALVDKNGVHIVYPYFEGRTLKEIVTDPLFNVNANQFRDIAAHFLMELQKIEDSGLIHCDAHPGNFIVKLDEQTKSVLSAHLIDFGSSIERTAINHNQLNNKSQKNRNNSNNNSNNNNNNKDNNNYKNRKIIIAGHPFYMSPEQAHYEIHETSDIYYAGSLLYWLVTKKHVRKKYPKLLSVMILILPFQLIFQVIPWTFNQQKNISELACWTARVISRPVQACGTNLDHQQLKDLETALKLRFGNAQQVESLCFVITKALQHDPNHRFQSPSEMLNAFLQAASFKENQSPIYIQDDLQFNPKNNINHQRLEGRSIIIIITITTTIITIIIYCCIVNLYLRYQSF